MIPFFAVPEDMRRIIYTTNAMESLTAKLRPAVRTRGHVPSDDSALKWTDERDGRGVLKGRRRAL